MREYNNCSGTREGGAVLYDIWRLSGGRVLWVCVPFACYVTVVCVLYALSPLLHAYLMFMDVVHVGVHVWCVRCMCYTCRCGC